MDDQRVGALFRAVRVKRRWRQADVADQAGVSVSMISRIERGHLDSIPPRAVRRVGAALDVRLEYTPRWRGGELDRLANARHAALHESVARRFATMPAWSASPEVSFSIYGERGVIDVLAWHPTTGTVLVIELKTDIVDVQELLATLDRKRRLAPTVARGRGWRSMSVAAWLVVLDSDANRRRLAAYDALVRSALPEDGRRMRGWLAHPDGPIGAASCWPVDTIRPAQRVHRRVRRRST